MPNIKPYEWQMKCGVILGQGKQLLTIPAGFGKSRVLISAAVDLSLKGKKVIVYFTNKSILQRDRADFDKVIKYNTGGIYGDTGVIELRYAIEQAHGHRSIAYNSDEHNDDNTFILYDEIDVPLLDFGGVGE